MDDEEDLTPEEVEALEDIGYGYPKKKEEQNIFAFFKRVINMPETTRTSNLTADELGFVKIPLRTNLSIALYCKQMGLMGLGSHFEKEAHITSDSSLSKDGFLDKLAVTQKREMETKTRKQTVANKGWFKKKEVIE